MGVGGDGGIMCQCPEADCSYISWDESSIQRDIILHLSKAEGQAIIELSGVGWVIVEKRKEKRSLLEGWGRVELGKGEP